MAIASIIMAESGRGKSYSTINLNPAECLLIQPITKPLPHKNGKFWKPLNINTGQGSVLCTDQPDMVIQAIQNAANLGRDKVIIDDAQYIMANQFMRSRDQKGFDKFNQIGGAFWDIVMAASNAPSHVRVYFLMHTEETDTGRIKAKTIGKMIDDKISLEGMFTIVMLAGVHYEQNGDSRNFFMTKNNGNTTVKTPAGMFDTAEIDNDLLMVDGKIKAYYGI